MRTMQSERGDTRDNEQPRRLRGRKTSCQAATTLRGGRYIPELLNTVEINQLSPIFTSR